MENSSNGAANKGDAVPPPLDEINANDDNLSNITEDEYDDEEELGDCLCVDREIHHEYSPGPKVYRSCLPMIDFPERRTSFRKVAQGFAHKACIELTSPPPLVTVTTTAIESPCYEEDNRTSSSESLAPVPRKRLLNSGERSLNTSICDAEEKYLLSCTSGQKVDEETVTRYCEIATAIHLDNDHNLKILLQNVDTTDGVRPALEEITQWLKKKDIKDPLLHSAEIQRRILEAVELNSLKCLSVLCDIYEKQPISRKEDIHLFHRRYGLSSWPLNERPKETALHLIANRHTSIKAMEVLEKRPKFLEDFSDIPDSHGSTPLLVAIKRNNMEVVKRLVKLTKKPSLRKPNKHNETPMYVAALNDHADIIREILEIYRENELLEVMKNIDGKGHSILYPASQSGKAKVLNLIMEQRWWPKCLEQERRIFWEWEWVTFVHNVCAAGCNKLARTILEQNNDLLNAKSHKGAITPLMRAAKANRKEIVQIIFDIKLGYDLFTTCDENGKNVFHYAVENPDILRYLLDQFTKLSKGTKAINKMDAWENTPIKLAAATNLESFKMLLNHTTNKVDIFSAHLIDIVDIETLKTGLLNWKQEDPKAVECLLNGDHEKHQPFLEAAVKGDVDLMEFFLEQGANHLQRTSEDQTVLHYAVLSGKLAAVEFLLKRKDFYEIIDFTDNINNTAAGYATITGEAEILRYLLENNAEIKSDTKTARLNILDCAYGDFETAENSIKEIVEFCTKDGKIELLEELFEDSRFGADCIMSQLIEKTPDVAMMIFDLCVIENKYHTYRSYGEMEVEKKIIYLFFPFKRKEQVNASKPDRKLQAIETMINSERDNCLGHPLVLRFLNEKMNSSRIQKWFCFNILLYLTFLFTLTVYGTIQSQGVYNLKSPGMIALSFIILVICALHFIKEIVQFCAYTANYINDFENYIEWVIFVCAVIYVVPGGSTKTKIQIAAGVISVFLGWINFSLFLKRFSLFGIYIIMAKKVFCTVCKVLPFVLLLIVAFSLSFSHLIRLDQGFKNIPISILTTFVMMTGELDYRDIFLPSGTLHVLQKILLVLFIPMISITVMNLLTGLAVGDINAIMARSKEEKRISKAKLVFSLERNSNYVPFLPPLEMEDFVVDALEKECQSSWLVRQWKKVYDDDEVEEQLKAMADKKKNDYGRQLNELKEEIKKKEAIEGKIENKLQKIEAMLEKFQPGCADAFSC